MQIVVYISAAVLLLVVAFITFRVFVRRDYRRRKRLSWFSVLLEILVFALHANFSYLFLPAPWPAWPQLPTNALHRVTGLVIIVAGLIGLIMGLSQLGWRPAFGQEVDEIRQTGIYGRTRNPQIFFYGLVVIGWAILWPSWSALGWVLLYAALAHLMVRTEEEHLRRMDRQSYDRYCERVPRYIPFPR